MKTIISLLLILVSLPLVGSPDDERNTEAYRLKADQARELQIQELTRECAKSAERAAELPADQAIPLYGYILIRLGGWQRPDTLEVYHNAQAKLLSIPGHATYFRDKLTVGKDAVRARTMTMNQWQDLTMNSFGILKRLPSEETVEVLTGFVDDKFGDATSTNPEDTNFPGYSFMDSGHYIVNDGAAIALETLGIEPAPYTDRYKLRYGEIKTIWSRWWQEVKAGKRKYRFKGSDVLHPVNAPSGAEREVRRPERHPGSTPVAKTQKEPVSEPVDETKVEKMSRHWPLLAAILAVLVAGLIYWHKVRGCK